MCRIASHFLLQKLKGRMLSDASDFNNIETQAVPVSATVRRVRATIVAVEKQ
jgi:hypothetical protein